jgi:hypothetical protein
VPTAKAFAGGGYETWFGEHSYLTTRACEIIEKESLEILSRLKRGDSLEATTPASLPGR